MSHRPSPAAGRTRAWANNRRRATNVWAPMSRTDWFRTSTRDVEGSGLRSAGAQQQATDAWERHGQATDAWERHGQAAYALACALLGDETAATRAVTLAMADFADSPVTVAVADARRTLARHVYWRCEELTGDTPRTLRLPPAMVRIGQLAQLQRTCLALCVFGGHTHRETATLVGLAPLAVADLLTSGLRELSQLAGGEPTPLPD